MATWQSNTQYSKRALVAAGNRMNLAQGLSSGGNRMVSSKIKRRNGRVALANLRMRFVNWYVTGGGVETANSADLTVTASVEYPAGTFHQVKVANAASFTVSRLVDYVDTDAVGIVIPANADYWVHTWADAGSGNNYPISVAQGRAAIDGYESGASVTDKTMTGGESGGASNTYGPAIVYGEAFAFAPCVLIVGDSIGNGSNDRTSSTGDAYGNAGYLERLIAPAGCNLINFGIPSCKSQDLATNGYASLRRRLSLLQGLTVTTIVNQFGINDITADRTLSQLLADQASWNSVLSALSDNILMATLLPKTTGSWGDAGGQAIASAAREAIRVAYNAAVRAGTITNQTGVIDPAIFAETAIDSGRWRADGGPWTDDGTHQISVGAAGIASGLASSGFESRGVRWTF